MHRVLVICAHNCALGLMAQAYLEKFGNDEFQVESAGNDPTAVDPVAVEAMREEGMDIPGTPARRIFDLYRAGQVYDYVLTLCGEDKDSRCPVFPGMTHRLRLPFQDPAALAGSHEEKVAAARGTRERIKEAMLDFIEWTRFPGKKHLGHMWEFKVLYEV